MAEGEGRGKLERTGCRRRGEFGVGGEASLLLLLLLLGRKSAGATGGSGSTPRSPLPSCGALLGYRLCPPQSRVLLRSCSSLGGGGGGGQRIQFEKDGRMRTGLRSISACGSVVKRSPLGVVCERCANVPVDCEGEGRRRAGMIQPREPAATRPSGATSHRPLLSSFLLSSV